MYEYFYQTLLKWQFVFFKSSSTQYGFNYQALRRIYFYESLDITEQTLIMSLAATLKIYKELRMGQFEVSTSVSYFLYDQLRAFRLRSLSEQF